MADINNGRIVFKKGKQKAFIDSALKFFDNSPKKFAIKINYGERAIRDWRKELYSIPEKTVREICKITRMPFPANTRAVSRYWYAKKAASLGGKALFKKYGGIVGDENRRRENWNTWWNAKGKAETSLRSKKQIHLPKQSLGLAEFTGIMLGDGGISKYQISITLNRIDDAAYSKYVSRLLHTLFKEKPKMHDRPQRSVVTIIYSRVDIVIFCNQKLGLPIGDKIKHGIDIPKWIQKKPQYLKACIRGLVDTDGSIVIETHRLGSQIYQYPRINFTSASPSLAKTFFDSLQKLGFSPKIRRGGRSIQLENIEEICKYFRVIGTSNPKHLSRIGKFI